MTRRALLVSLAASATALRSFGQESPGQVGAAIEGKIETDVGRPVPNGTVFLDGSTRQFHLEANSNSSGHYGFENLPPGKYTLWCELQGHGCIVYPNLSLGSGERLHRDFRFSNRDNGCES